MYYLQPKYGIELWSYLQLVADALAPHLYINREIGGYALIEPIRSLSGAYKALLGLY